MNKSRRKFLKWLGRAYGVAAATLFNPVEGYAGIFSEENNYKTKRENLYDDSEDVLLARMLFGEGRSVSTAEKIVIGFTPLNRAKDGKSYTGNTLKDAILKNRPVEIESNGKKKIVIAHQYSCFNSWDPNFKKIENPLRYNKERFEKCLRISRNLLDGEYNKYNFGPTHYLKKDLHPKPSWAKKMKRLDSTGFVHQFYRS